MSAAVNKEIQLEIGHVLFVDIVGYSKLLITEQSEQLQTLKEIVRATEQFRRAEAADKLLRLPTGDGGALVFRTSPDAPVLCALEISKELKKHPEPQVAMLTVRTHYVPDYNAITAWATLAAVLAALFLALLWEPIRRRWNAPKLELQLRDRDIDESLGTSVTGGVVVTRNVRIMVSNSGRTAAQRVELMLADAYRVSESGKTLELSLLPNSFRLL